mmetsp:Transcript_33419/g.78131  ORF Transcript_33419/g.78131 Transcript_33419/m.78131 type:complete len:163 (+) Transcript_33419:95-583(+)|eukprot:CAMPEP_0178405742 /NCGR_PEP_ID=MMETSP0689_2-20121128/18555_1 /TAXON_ID=160604 /ORGANISM="Amphidinium massartii, Strain CS-259" /LENGTH=162 /DNA_ID=CAMNT_0020026765 /DNA_START=83 /DNA_END=571 /DNA_ORIENTATION=-
MQVFVRTLEGETTVVQASSSASAAWLLASVGSAEATLSYGGYILSEEQSLSDAGVQDGATLFVCQALNGGGDGTPAMGKRHKKTHMLCARCGKRSFHVQKKRCASCGYPDKKMRGYRWSIKSNRRRAPGTGRMKHLRHMPRRFKNGFREGTTPPARKKNLKQ